MINCSTRPELDPRCRALESAVLFRDCAARLRTSRPTRQVCRRLMRERALLWRHLTPPEIGSGKPA